MAEANNPFAKYEAQAWPFWYRGELIASRICGGVPSNEKTAEAWIRAKLKDTRSEDEIKKQVADTIAELRATHEAAGRKTLAELESDEVYETPSEDTLTAEAVAKVASDLAGFNVFKRTPDSQLVIEGRQLKAALKEAVAVAANAGLISTKGWGNPDNAAYKKQLKGWFPEHVFIVEQVLPLFTEAGEPLREPSEVLQKFVHTHRGDAIGREEVVNRALIRFTAKTNVELSEKDWAMIWLTGQDQGLGASRSQGFGTYEMTVWEPVSPREGRKLAEANSRSLFVPETDYRP